MHLKNSIFVIFFLLAPRLNGAMAHDDPMIALNNVFKETYKERLALQQKDMGPIIVESGGRLYLYKSDGTMEKASCLDARYHHLKTIAHIPLSLFLMIQPYVEQAPNEALQKKLEAYRHLVEEVKGTLSSANFSPQQLQRQKDLVEKSLVFLDSCLAREQITQHHLDEFSQSTVQDIQANVMDAARSQIVNMDKQIKIWKTAMSETEWERIRISLTGQHMPATGNVALQYFALLLGEPYQGKFQQENMKSTSYRLLYSEMGFSRNFALDNLARHLLDRDIGQQFFKDDQRMHRDLLGDAAESILKEFFPQPGN